MTDDSFWCPTRIDWWRTFLLRGIPDDGTFPHTYALVSNIGYNLQYLQFLENQIRETSLHATVYTQTLKTFIITGMGIVEAIFWCVLKRNGQIKTTQWRTVTQRRAPNFVLDEKELRITNLVEEKLSVSEDVEMSLHSMIRRVENKRLLGIDLQVYRDMNYLRALRNKVHIHDSEHSTDTDWNAFNNNEYKLMKKALYGILTTEVFSPEQKHIGNLSFLLVQEDTDDVVSEFAS